MTFVSLNWDLWPKIVILHLGGELSYDRQMIIYSTREVIHRRNWLVNRFGCNTIHSKLNFQLMSWTFRSTTHCIILNKSCHLFLWQDLPPTPQRILKGMCSGLDTQLGPSLEFEHRHSQAPVCHWAFVCPQVVPTLWYKERLHRNIDVFCTLKPTVAFPIKTCWRSYVEITVSQNRITC